MQVTLKSISFNYHSDLSKTGAFHLRRNETQTVIVPEWQPHVCANHECSPVGYRINELPVEMTIQASIKNEGAQSVLVRAIAESGHLLGNTSEETIPANTSAVKTFKLSDARATVMQAGIGRHDIVWRWQFSITPGNWTEFQTTRHRVYTVLARPQSPWMPDEDDSDEIHQPWTEVLDYACKWAEGVKGTVAAAGDEATRLITNQVYDLGATLFMHATDPGYAHKLFDCTLFLELLRTRVGHQTVNCEDCATIVSTFANILGCELWQSCMTAAFGFDTNHVLQIGDRDQWAPTGFVQHTVAWKGACREQDLLFDAFLLVDGDDKPFEPPPVALRPSGTTFGAAGDKTYRFRLVHPDSFCAPAPDDARYKRQRRRLGKTYFGQAKIASPTALKNLKQIYKFDSWPKPTNATKQKHLDDFSTETFNRDVLFPDWGEHSSDHFTDDQFRNVTHLLVKRLEPDTSRLFAINLYECTGPDTVNDRLLQIISVFNQSTIKQVREPIGELTFADEGQTKIVFRYGSFIAVVTSAGRQSVNVKKFALALYHYLQQIVGTSHSTETTMEEQSTEAEAAAEAAAVPDFSFLALDWRGFKTAGPTHIPQARLDLKNLQANGTLTAGLMIPVDPAQPATVITGRVSQVGNIIQIILERPRYGRYEGFLTFRHPRDPEMVISGKLTYAANLRILDDGTERLADQIQEPWVILKP